MAKGSLQKQYEKVVLDNLDLKERIKELEKRIEAARIIIDSQSFWCDLANKECVGMKSIVHLVENALEE